MEALKKPNNIKIHFIIGSGRSGTTLLSYILNNHENCVSTPETKHLLFFYKKYHAISKVNQKLIDDLKHYFSIMLQSEGVVDYQKYLKIEPYFKLGEKITYFELCCKIYLAFANQKDLNKVTCIIDKNPSYTIQVDKLNGILPDAKYLCLIRDYRGFVLSNIESPEPYAKHLPIQYHSLVWVFYNKLIFDIKKKYGDKIMVLSYEELVSNKEKALLDICNFFNLKYTTDLFNYQDKIYLEKEPTQKDERLLSKRNTLEKPINANRLDAWKGVFTSFQLKTIEFWCSKIGTNFNYKTTIKVNLFESIAILFISFPYYIRVWAYFKLKSTKLFVLSNEVRKAKYFNSINKK
jgi:hypothetical protein